MSSFFGQQYGLGTPEDGYCSLAFPELPPSASCSPSHQAINSLFAGMNDMSESSALALANDFGSDLQASNAGSISPVHLNDETQNSPRSVNHALGSASRPNIPQSGYYDYPRPPQDFYPNHGRTQDEYAHSSTYFLQNSVYPWKQPQYCVQSGLDIAHNGFCDETLQMTNAISSTSGSPSCITEWPEYQELEESDLGRGNVLGTPHDDLDEDENSCDKPYARLIYEALLQAPGHKMMLREIYSWFQRNTNKARESGSNGWQNSIRHNLSMNQAFENDKSEPATARGQSKKANSVWVLTENAIKNGVQSTTRYRKAGSGKKAQPSKLPAPLRQRSGAKGGRAARRAARLRKTQNDQLSDQFTFPGIASPHDIYQPLEFRPPLPDMDYTSICTPATPTGETPFPFPPPFGSNDYPTRLPVFCTSEDDYEMAMQLRGDAVGVHERSGQKLPDLDRLQV